ncbi:MAG: hypothetical protein K8U57_28745 [Planctomycetes bacterium]|nr:hypothetical protein [Planctomycetota bacterium]
MTLFRRFCVVQALLLWQGGFLFYAAFVVPTGTKVLGSAAAQGAITARVTDSLNVIGVVALALLAWDLNGRHDHNRRRTLARRWCWVVMLVCQGLLFYLHERLDSFMDPTRMRIETQARFYPVHAAYLWTSTMQWLACLFLMGITLAAWRAEERHAAHHSH